MTYVVLALLLVLAAWFAPKYASPDIPFVGGLSKPFYKIVFRGVLGIFAFFCILSTSIIKIPADQIGVVRLLYGYSNLPEGHIIATQGETGYQAEIIPPGTFRISFFFNILNDITYMPVVKVPQGVYARVVARDGSNLREGQIMADAWPDVNFTDFLNAQYFMTHGGQRGLQSSVLKPGTYPINLKLFEIRIGYQPNGKDIQKHADDIYDDNGYSTAETPLDTSITRVPAGFVGVVRSSIETVGTDCKAKKATVGDNDSLSAVLVPVGCKGIWEHALTPNDYYLNRDGYDVIQVDTRVQTLEFKGGYKLRAIDLTINSVGDFEQKERPPVDVPKGEGSADVAVFAKAEGWNIPQELRAVVQISPDHAPIIVAAVGGLKEVEERIMVPSIRSHVRNVFGGYISVPEVDKDGKSTLVARQTRVLDTVENRQVLEAAILALVKIDGTRAGVDVKEIRLGDSVIPPELLLARQRQQLAGQLKTAFEQEQIAQEQRKSVAAARAQADQQATLVTAQIGVETAKLGQQKREAEGNAERIYLQQIAIGQKAQTDVLGADKVFMSIIVEKALAALREHPEMLSSIKFPQYLFLGGNDTTNSAGMLATSPALKSILGGGDPTK